MLYIGGEALSPKGTDQVLATTGTAFKVLPIAAQHPAQLYLASSLVLLGLGALAVSYGAIATLVTARGSLLATIAALVGGLGAFCGAIVNVVVYPILAAAATSHVPRDAAAKLLVTASDSEFGHVFMYVYFVSEYLAPLLMAIALWRSRTVPRWLAVLSSWVSKLPREWPRTGRSSSCSCCRLRRRWSCWPPGSGGPPQCRTA